MQDQLAWQGKLPSSASWTINQDKSDALLWLFDQIVSHLGSESPRTWLLATTRSPNFRRLSLNRLPCWAQLLYHLSSSRFSTSLLSFSFPLISSNIMIGVVYSYPSTTIPPTHSLHASNVPRSSYSTLSSALIETLNAPPHLRNPPSLSGTQNIASTSTGLPRLFDCGEGTPDDHSREVDERFLSNYSRYVPSLRKTYCPLNILIFAVTQPSPTSPMPPR